MQGNYNLIQYCEGVTAKKTVISYGMRNDPLNDLVLKYQYTAKNPMVNHVSTVFPLLSKVVQSDSHRGHPRHSLCQLSFVCDTK